MKTPKHKVLAVLLIALTVAVFGLIACQTAQPVEQPVHVLLDNAYEIGAAGESPAGAYGDTNVTNLDASGYLNYGPADLYPVGNPVDGTKFGAGMTAAKVQSATVVPTVYAMTTVTAFGCVPDDAVFTGAWYCKAAMGSSNNITFTLVTNAQTPVPTASYDEIRYWVAGN